MHKTVVFIGGANGAGKTTLVNSLVASDNHFAVAKQKRTLIEVAKRHDIPWEQAPEKYEELINEVADVMAKDFENNPAEVLLIDCHYAFKLQKCLIAHKEKRDVHTDEPYIQAIDNRVIDRMAKDFQVKFVFVEVDPQVALERVSIRKKDIGDQNSTSLSLANYQEQERRFYQEIVQRLELCSSQQLILQNNGTLEDGVQVLINFIFPIEETVIYEGKKNLLRWHSGSTPIPSKNITQVRGYIFDAEGRILIVESHAQEHSTTIGGHPEGNETPVETFRREVMEEACVEIEQETYIGFIEGITESSSTPFFQVRYAARLKKALPFEPKFETIGYKFVMPDEIGQYIPWTNKSPIFAEEIKAAMAAYAQLKK